MKQSSESDLSEQMQDQLSELWTNAQQKRRAMLSQLTPYHKRTAPLNLTAPPRVAKEQPEKNKQKKAKEQTASNATGGKDEESDLQVLRLREQLQQSVLQGQQRQMEMDLLRKTAQQLTNENKYLVRELHHGGPNDENNSKVLNQSSIHPRGKSNSTKKHKPRNDKHNIRTVDHTTLSPEDPSRQRLVELVRSTSEYRSYVFYYDSNQLSFLRKLQDQHKRNCERTPGQRERGLWGPAALLEELKGLSEREGLGLKEEQVQEMVGRLKGYFEGRCERRLARVREGLQERLRRAQRQGQNGVPYELVQVARARQRQLARWGKRSASHVK